MKTFYFAHFIQYVIKSEADIRSSGLMHDEKIKQTAFNYFNIVRVNFKYTNAGAVVLQVNDCANTS